MLRWRPIRNGKVIPLPRYRRGACDKPHLHVIHCWAVLHPFLNNPSVTSHDSQSLLLLLPHTSARPAPIRHYLRLPRSMTASLAGAPVSSCNASANPAPGSGYRAAVLPLRMETYLESAKRQARDTLRRNHLCLRATCNLHPDQRNISGHIEACVMADRCGAEPRWPIRCGNVRTNDGFRSHEANYGPRHSSIVYSNAQVPESEPDFRLVSGAANGLSDGPRQPHSNGSPLLSPLVRLLYYQDGYLCQRARSPMDGSLTLSPLK